MMKHKSIFNQISRRHFIKGSCAGWLILNGGLSGAATTLNSVATNASASANKKVVWIFLRGALDPLHTVFPVTDLDFWQHRGALVKPIKNQLLSLNQNFALHPNLPYLHQLYKEKQMSPVVAVATGYRARSHFDAQDQMESGLDETAHDNGWIARASMQVSKQYKKDNAHANSVAISRSIPIAMRGGDTRAETWYPSVFPEADEDLLQRLGNLYENDEALHHHLQALVQQKQNPSMQMQGKRRPNFLYLAKRCGELLANNQTQFAMLELGGWDTHNNQNGRLARLFTQLDNGIKALRESLSSSWNDTLVIVSTEFGRTVSVNGTGGTDHGTGASMFLIGGALNKPSAVKQNKNKAMLQKAIPTILTGGQVYGTWPGLSANNLYQGRDLMPTTDTRKWMSAGLLHQWDLPAQSINAIFPDLTQT